MTERSSWIGKTIGNRYRIDELIGQGGMSAVYKAYDPNLRRVVAIKVIHSFLADDPRFISRFEEEATAVAQLRHPNIVLVHDFNTDGDIYYMVQEFIPGESLQERLRRLNRTGRVMPFREVCDIFIQVSDAVGYANKRGLIHRDIKPANIMINTQEQAILMDFGIVKITGGNRHTATGAVVGTALYLAPETIRGETADARSDIYSLGVTLFETVSGKPPYQADSAMSLMMMHLNDPVPDLRSLRPGVPDELMSVIDMSLEKAREKRYQSADEMSLALRKVLDDLPSEDPLSYTVADKPEKPPVLPPTEVQSPAISDEKPSVEVSSPEEDTPTAEQKGSVTPQVEATLLGSTSLEASETGSTTTDRKDSIPTDQSSTPTATQENGPAPEPVLEQEVSQPQGYVPVTDVPLKKSDGNKRGIVIAGVVVAAIVLIACGLILGGGYIYSRSKATPTSSARVTEIVVEGEPEASPTPEKTEEETSGEADPVKKTNMPTEVVDEPIDQPSSDATATSPPASDPGSQTGGSFPKAVVEEAWADQYLILDVAFGKNEWITTFIDDPGGRSQGWNAIEGDPEAIFTQRYQDGFYITAVTYSEQDGWLVVFTKDVGYTDQWWVTDTEYPEDFINQRWSEGYMITSIAYGGGEWMVIMSLNSGIEDQAWNTDSFFNTEAISEREVDGLYLSSLAFGDGLWALIFSKYPGIIGQDWVTGQSFPGDEVDAFWEEGFDISSMTYGNSTWVVVLTEFENQDDIYWESTKLTP